MKDIDVNVTVNVNGQPSTPIRKPNRRKGVRDDSTLHEFYSKDGWSWMGVRTELIWPYRFVRISVELQVKREFWGTWINETDGLKQLEISGTITDPNGTRENIDEFVHLPGGVYTRVFDYSEEGWMGPPKARLRVKKSHGYWTNAGPDSHVCEGTINSYV